MSLSTFILVLLLGAQLATPLPVHKRQDSEAQTESTHQSELLKKLLHSTHQSEGLLNISLAPTCLQDGRNFTDTKPLALCKLLVLRNFAQKLDNTEELCELNAINLNEILREGRSLAISTSADISNDSDFYEYCYVKYVEKMTTFIIREIKKGVVDSQMYDNCLM